MSLLHSPRARSYGLLLINTFFWGIASPIIKASLETVSYNQFLLWRYIIATLIFLPYFLIFLKPKIKNPKQHSKLDLIGLALLGTPLTLIPMYYGIRLTSAVEASIIASTTPILIVTGGWLFLKEKITTPEKIGLFIAIAGTCLIVLEPILNRNPVTSGSALGNALILASNFIWTAYVLIDKKIKVNSSQISLTSYLISIPIFLLFSLLEIPGDGLPPLLINLPLTAILGILYMAVFGSVIAFWAYSEGQKHIEASEAAIFTYLQPIFAIPLAVFWLHEPVSSLVTLASLIIILGVYISEKR